MVACTGPPLRSMQSATRLWRTFHQVWISDCDQRSIGTRSIGLGVVALGIDDRADIVMHPSNNLADVRLGQLQGRGLQARQIFILRLVMVRGALVHALLNGVPDGVIQWHPGRCSRWKRHRPDLGRLLGSDAFAALVALAITILHDDVLPLGSPFLLQRRRQRACIHGSCGSAVPPALDDMPHDDLVVCNCRRNGHRWYAEEGMLLPGLCAIGVKPLGGFAQMPSDLRLQQLRLLGWLQGQREGLVVYIGMHPFGPEAGWGA